MPSNYRNDPPSRARSARSSVIDSSRWQEPGVQEPKEHIFKIYQFTRMMKIMHAKLKTMHKTAQNKMTQWRSKQLWTVFATMKLQTAA